MFKRVFWLTAGMVTGSWLTLRFKRRVQETVTRLMPDQMASDLGTKVRSVATDVRDAAREGRAAMKAREESLRSELIDQ